MATDMRKTPSHLKGLAETRARADGDIHRIQRLRAEIDPKRAEALRIEAIHAQVTANLAAARTERDACDLLIRKFGSRLDPEPVAPVRAVKGRARMRADGVPHSGPRSGQQPLGPGVRWPGHTRQHAP